MPRLYPACRGAKLGMLPGGISCRFHGGKLIFRRHYGRTEYHVSLQEIWDKIVLPEIPPASDAPIETDE